MTRLRLSRRALAAALLLLLAPPAARAAPPAADPEARVRRVLAATPLVDGHNDLPEQLFARFKSDLDACDLAADTSKLPGPPGEPPLMTDLPRLRLGQVGGVFWSVWVPAKLVGPAAVQATLAQIDLVHRLAARYPKDLAMASTAADVRRLHKAGAVASLIGVEGGHQINGSLPVLRQYYALGARYLTLTHSANVEWADSATDRPEHHGLTPFGHELVRELNRMGMLVDLSHVSPDVMKQVLAQAEAPVIFSHSSARALVDHPRNVPDDVLQLVKQNGGVVMVNFAPGYVCDACFRWEADHAAEAARHATPPFGGLYLGQPERAKAAMAAWEKAHPRPVATLAQVADHLEHIRDVAGVDSVGLGSDFDGIPSTPAGLDGVDRFPALLAELVRRGWSDADVAKVAGENLLRALATTEEVAARLSRQRRPSQATVEALDHPPAPAAPSKP